VGVTAAASAGVYLRRGYIDPGLAMPAMLGVLAGALIGAVFAVFLGRVLRAGVMAATMLVLVGGVVFLSKRGLSPTDYHVFRGEPADLTSIRGIFTDAAAGYGRGLIQLGLLVLIGTPVVRVICSVAGFARERDWMYVAITTIVFGVLAYSLLAA
jgi:uncharacterized membrane protein